MSNLPPSINKKKTFTIADWDGSKEGEKIMIHGQPGIGKTTLAILAPTPVFIGMDDGGRKMSHPITGKRLKVIPNITSFGDVRDALRQVNIFDDYQTIVIDTITELERWALPYTFITIPKEKGGPAKNVEDYGWHKGYRYWYDTMRLILQDCDSLVRRGKNIIFVAQSSVIKVANPGGEDFLKEAPELYHDDKVSILNSYVSWCDHVFRLGYTSITVDKEHKAASDQVRAVFVCPEIHFMAKSRNSFLEEQKVISFKDKKDNSIWRFLFGERK